MANGCNATWLPLDEATEAAAILLNTRRAFLFE